ncbi:MAG: DUF3006 domain-containing protein [Clostridia bacterium]|nr:DUF3006 domain-containing protein [Clostridia bacterium]MBR5747078.1 DUF3006 domain-containing protein [Clostridia bacterium]
MKVTIDRFEGEYAIAVLENGETAQISKKLLPRGNEGDVIRITFDRAATERRRRESRALFDSLCAPGGEDERV